MSEISSELPPESPIEHPQPPSQEKSSLPRKIATIGRRLLQKIKRPEQHNPVLPEQVFSPTGIVKEAKKINPERARRISEEGCAVRAIMSAAALAAGEKSISASQDEWDARFKQMDQPHAPSEVIEQELLDLYARYAQNDTPLGNAVDKVAISLTRGEDEEAIKARIRSGEQVMVLQVHEDFSHIFHAGLDKKGRVISLSDKQATTLTGKKKYERANISQGTFTTYSVTPK